MFSFFDKFKYYFKQNDDSVEMKCAGYLLKSKQYRIGLKDDDLPNNKRYDAYSKVGEELIKIACERLKKNSVKNQSLFERYPKERKKMLEDKDYSAKLIAYATGKSNISLDDL